MTGRVVSLFRVTSRGEVRPHGGATAPTMRALWDWFFTEVAHNPLMGMRGRTALNYQRTRDLCLELMGDEHPSNRMVEEFTRVIANPPYSFKRSTVYHHWKNLRAVYRYGNDGGPDVVQGNPCAFMKLARPEPTIHAIQNIDQLWPLLIEAMPDARARAWLALERYLGRRPGEVRGLRRDDITREGENIRVWVRRQRAVANSMVVETLKNAGRGERTYAITPRHVLYPFLVELLDLGPARIRTGLGGCNGWKESPFFFPYREHEQAELMRRLREVAPLAFPPGKAWRTFRHTLALDMNRRGADDSAIAEMVGSSPDVIRQTYIGVYGQRVRSEVMALYETGGPAPPGGPAAEKREAGVGAPASQERSKAVTPTAKQEVQRCSTPSQSESKRSSAGAAKMPRSARSQRALPGLAVGPVVRKRKR